MRHSGAKRATIANYGVAGSGDIVVQVFASERVNMFFALREQNFEGIDYNCCRTRADACAQHIVTIGNFANKREVAKSNVSFAHAFCIVAIGKFYAQFDVVLIACFELANIGSNRGHIVAVDAIEIFCQCHDSGVGDATVQNEVAHVSAKRYTCRREVYAGCHLLSGCAG